MSESVARKVIIFGTSLDPKSKSQILAREVLRRVVETEFEVELVDLRELDLPESGRPGAADSRVARDLRRKVAGASHVVFAAAIYNYDVSSAAKNLLELLTAGGMMDKVVGFVCAAGGRNSYMSVMSFANSLMLDFRAWIVPRYVYAIGSDFEDGVLVNQDIHERLDVFVGELTTGPAGFRSGSGDLEPRATAGLVASSSAG